MLARLQVPDSQLDSPLGQVSPVVKLGVAFAWLAGLALTLDPRPPLVLAAAAAIAAMTAGAVPPLRYFRGAAPLLVAAVSIGLFNMLFAAANADPLAKVAFQLGPF